ncbi:tail fiber assembly protein [Escherichia coli]
MEHIKIRQLHKSMYRLNRVDTSLSPDIEWPSQP